MKNKKLKVATCVCMAMLLITGSALADSGNSQSQIDSSSSQTVKVTKNNVAQESSGNGEIIVNNDGSAGETNITLENNTTGAESRNNVSKEESVKINIDNKNDLNINNDVTVKSNTGKNEAMGNAGGISIKTGNANAEVSISNKANMNETTITLGEVLPTGQGGAPQQPAGKIAGALGMGGMPLGMGGGGVLPTAGDNSTLFAVLVYVILSGSLTLLARKKQLI